MALFNQVAIIGVGLIGGSIGLELKRNRLCQKVIGVSFHRKSIILAKQKKAIDSGSQDIRTIKEADLVIFATPVDIILQLAPLVSKIIKKDCIVIDVGSTKEDIVHKLDRIFPAYLGTHPLAGSEKKGISQAKINLFKNSLVIITPTMKTKPNVINKVRKFWQLLGAKVISLSEKNHDRVLAFTSHLPHIVAFSLINAIPNKYLHLSSGGLKDTTRIASSNHQLWSGIFLSNQKNILKTIDLFEKQLILIKSAIKQSDKKKIEKILKHSKEKRDLLE